MNILITNYYLLNHAGTENYVIEIAKYFSNNGHKVVIYSPVVGKIIRKHYLKGICVVDNLEKIDGINFDIIHAHHNIIAIITRLYFPNVPMVFVSHGVLPKLESPPILNINISMYIAISEEVRDYLESFYNIQKEHILVVRNFVNFRRFNAKKNINSQLKKILVLSNHYTNEAKKIIEPVCEKLSIRVDHVGLPENPVQNVEKYINKSDLVVTVGKGVLESIACKRNVIVYDWSGSDGFLTKDSYYELRKNNFSGRRFGRKLNKDEFENLLKEYSLSNVNEIYDIVKKEHSIEKVCNQLLKCYVLAKEKHHNFSSTETLVMQKKIRKMKDVYLWKIIVQYLRVRHWKKLCPCNYDCINQLFTR